jgi:hypothetical protein
MMHKTAAGYVVVPDDQQELLQTPRLDKVVRGMERAKLGVLPLGLVIWLAVGMATGNFGMALAIVVPISFFLLAVAEFVYRTVNVVGRVALLRRQLRAHDQAGRLVRLPKGLVKLVGVVCGELSIPIPSGLFDHDYNETRELVRLYRKNGDTPPLRKRLKTLITQIG